jgi:hypothetical protein
LFQFFPGKINARIQHKKTRTDLYDAIELYIFTFLSNTCIVPTGTGTYSSIPPIIPRKPGDRWNKLPRQKKSSRIYGTVPYFQKLGLNVAALFFSL